jgi:hypothetical protein
LIENLKEEFHSFANIGESISHTRSKNEKIRILGKYLRALSDESLKIAVLFFLVEYFLMNQS